MLQSTVIGNCACNFTLLSALSGPNFCVSVNFLEAQFMVQNTINDDVNGLHLFLTVRVIHFSIKLNKNYM
jgi:hypothetical protein